MFVLPSHVKRVIVLSLPSYEFWCSSKAINPQHVLESTIRHKEIRAFFLLSNIADRGEIYKETRTMIRSATKSQSVVKEDGGMGI